MEHVSTYLTLFQVMAASYWRPRTSDLNQKKMWIILQLYSESGITKLHHSYTLLHCVQFDHLNTPTTINSNSHRQTPSAPKWGFPLSPTTWHRFHCKYECSSFEWHKISYLHSLEWTTAVLSDMLTGTGGKNARIKTASCTSSDFARLYQWEKCAEKNGLLGKMQNANFRSYSNLWFLKAIDVRR